MKMINTFTGMIDLFDSWFTRFTSEDHSYGSPEIKLEPQEESNEYAAKEEQKQAAIEEKKETELTIPTASPDPKPVPTVVQEGTLDDDINALAQYFGILQQGQTIQLTLREILAICPRHRQRSDAYVKLTKKLLTEYGVELKIISKQNKQQ